MNSRTVTRDREVVAEGEYGSLTIYSDTSELKGISYGSYLVKFTLRSGSGIISKTPPHWHETHTEYVRVTSGKAFVMVDGRTSIIDSNSEEICIPRGVVHAWGVANDCDEELIIWERTEPIDGEKEIFFRNLISSLVDSSMGNPFSKQSLQRRLSLRDILQFLVTFRALDNYPLIWNGFGRRHISYLMLSIGDFCGRTFFGLKPFYFEYTPDHLWEKNKVSDFTHF